MAVCDHVDVITTIIDYFNHFGVGSRLKDESGMYNNAIAILRIY